MSLKGHQTIREHKGQHYKWFALTLSRPGGGGFYPLGLWTSMTFIKFGQTLFFNSENYLEKNFVVGYSPLALMLAWQPFFDRQFYHKIENSYLKWRKITTLSVNFMFLAHISVPLSVLITLIQFWRFPQVLGKSRNPRWRIEDGRHLEIIT